jgi:hypothetical protein
LEGSILATLSLEVIQRIEPTSFSIENVIRREIKNGQHNFYERPERQTRPEANHGGRDTCACATPTFAYNSKAIMHSARRRVGMVNDPKGEKVGNEKPAVTLPGVVERIVKPITPSEPEKAQIVIQGADDLYREIRVENTLANAAGEKVRLKPGAEVDVTIEAPAESVEKKPT